MQVHYSNHTQLDILRRFSHPKASNEPALSVNTPIPFLFLLVIRRCWWLHWVAFKWAKTTSTLGILNLETRLEDTGPLNLELLHFEARIKQTCTLGWVLRIWFSDNLLLGKQTKQLLALSLQLLRTRHGQIFFYLLEECFILALAHGWNVHAISGMRALIHIEQLKGVALLSMRTK